MRTEYKPNPVIVDRAVELWKRLLANPKYDNIGDTGTPHERVACGMASALASMIPSNATPERLGEFGRHLRESLMAPRHINDLTYYEDSLHVDYGPDGTLADAAKASGLKMEWPWKTGMWLYTDRVGLSVGYCAPSVYHYPLSGGRWLVTTLTGGDIAKVIAAVEAGSELGLTVETGWSKS